MTMRLEEDDMNENEEGETRAPSHRADDYKRRRTLRLPATLDQLNMLATELNEDDDDDGNQLPDRQPLFQDSPRVVKQGSSVGPSHHQIVGMLEMSAKNKITTKNAFDLKLIDVLKDAVKNETFSHAGSLLDASAKIYSYRVDKTHQDAYRVLSNLGKEDTIEENEGAEDDGLGGTAAQQKRPKRKHKSTATIESNARAITLTSTDVDYEDDALFRKTVAQFDEGASTGLLMNQTLSAGDGQHILLHCISAPERTDFIAADDPLVDADLVELLKMVTSNPSEEIEQEEIGLCQALSDFDFRSWKADDCLPSSSQDISQSSVFRTDVDANCSVDLSDHDGVHDDVMMVVDENEPADDGPEPEEAHLLRQPRRTTRLQNVIADPQQQDLSYFDQSKMNALKGPDHWKIANGRKPKPEQPKRRVNKAARLKARAAKIELDDSDPEDNLTLAEIMRLYNNVGERKVTLSVEAQKANKAKKQFDAVAEYDATVLARLGLRPEVTVSRRPSSAPCLTDDGTDNYNYENANDSVNFCAEPRAQSAPPEAAPITEETVLMASQESLLEDDTVADTTVDDYDEPCQSQTLPLRPSAKPVPYAKTQKKIDARGLKRAMKKIIGGKGPTQSQSQSSSQDPNDNFSLGDNKTFADLCQRLPEKVSKSSAADLTVPITFVIFLHLCNEHTLELKQEPGETNDFKITQG